MNLQLRHFLNHFHTHNKRGQYSSMTRQKTLSLSFARSTGIGTGEYTVAFLKVVGIQETLVFLSPDHLILAKIQAESDYE